MDETLWGREQLAAEEIGSFADWYAESYSRLVRVVAAMYGSVDAGHDLASDACVQLYERWGQRRPDDPFAWATTVAINRGRRAWRRSRREEARLPLSPLNQAAAASLGEHDVEVWAAIAGLPFRMRQAVVLRYVADMTEPEVARAMGTKPGTVAATLHNARKRLATELERP